MTTSYRDAFPIGGPAPKNLVRDWARGFERAVDIANRLEPMPQIAAVNGVAELAARRISAGRFAGLYHHRDAASGIRIGPVLRALALVPQVFTETEARDCLEAVIRACVVTPRTAGTAIEVGAMRAVGGRLLECTTAGTTGGGALDVSALAANASIADGTVIWTRRALVGGTTAGDAPASWATFLVDVAPASPLRDPLAPLAGDGLAGLLVTACHAYVVRHAAPAWLAAASGHAAGTRAELLHALMVANVESQINHGDGIDVPTAWQGGVAPDGAADNQRPLTVAVESWSGAVAMAAINGGLGYAAEAAAMTTLAGYLRAGILALHVPAQDLFRLRYGQSDEALAALSGDGGFEGLRVGLWPLLYNLPASVAEVQTYATEVYAAIAARCPDILIRNEVGALPMGEFWYAAGGGLGIARAREELGRRVQSRASANVDTTSLALNIAVITAARGERGPAGANGADGADGATGATGPQGLPGVSSGGVGGYVVALPRAASGLRIVSAEADAAGRVVTYTTSDGTVYTLAGAVAGNLSVGGVLSVGGGALDPAKIPQEMPSLPSPVPGVGIADASRDPSGRLATFLGRDGRLYSPSGGAYLRLATETPEPAIARYGDAAYDRTAAATLHPLWGAHVPDSVGVRYLILQIGQSWDQGANAATAGATIRGPYTPTALNPGVVRMLGGGGGINPRGVYSATLVDAVEGSNMTNSQESGLCRAAREINEFIVAASGAARQIVVTVSASGGQPIESCLPGGVIWSNLLNQVSAINAAVRAEGSMLVVLGAVINGGQQNFRGITRAGAAALYRRLHAALNDPSLGPRGITRQAAPVPLYLSQVASGGTGVEDLDVAFAALDVEGPGIVIAGAQYAYQADGDGSVPGEGGHLSAYGLAARGVHLGHAITQHAFRAGYAPPRILRQNTRWLAGATPIVELVYNRPVTVDSSGVWVSPVGLAAAGFDVVDDAGTAMSISAVTPVAHAMTAAVAGNVITFGGPGVVAAGDNIMSRCGAGAFAVVITVAGMDHAVEVQNADLTFAALLTELARLTGGTTTGLTVTCPSAPVVSIITNRLRLTLSAWPARGEPRLYYACRATGPAVGGALGARGLVRAAMPTGLISDPTSTNRQTRDWALMQRVDLPRP